jgi:hypothetical protein
MSRDTYWHSFTTICFHFSRLNDVAISAAAIRPTSSDVGMVFDVTSVQYEMGTVFVATYERGA